MIHGYRIVAFTPCGRKRYMDLLTAHMIREHSRGHIDKWYLFNNAYTIEDSTYAAQLKSQFDWVEVISVGETTATRTAGQISTFYASMREPNEDNVIYVRLDDDLVYIDEQAITNLVAYRIAHPAPFLVYPTIINNTRTSYALQAAGLIPMEWGAVEPILCAPTAWRDSRFVFRLHQKALASIENGTLVADFTLPSGQFPNYELGNISINSFAIFGRDMHACNVAADEETYLSMRRPQEMGRPNARCGDAMVVHFAYHTQTEFMDKSGMLLDYANLVAPLPFRTVRVPPEIVTNDDFVNFRTVPVSRQLQQRNSLIRAARNRPGMTA
jgi:hypothetical protein